MKFRLLLIVLIGLASTGCFSVLIKKDNSAEEAYREKIKFQQDEANKKYDTAKGIYLVSPNLNGLKKAVEFCQTIANLFERRTCYGEIFSKNQDKNICKEFDANQIVQYICYAQVLKEKKILASEAKTFCPDTICLSAYAYRHYGTEGAQPELQPYREEARKIESETGYHRQIERISYPSKGLEFHEVWHTELRTNRAFGLGYDLNFKYNGSELPSLGIGYYNLAEKIYSIDLTISAVQKPVAARIALGAEFKADYETRYHVLYALGLSGKLAGAAPLLEISSDFKKDHQVVLGFMFLFQPAR